MEETVKQSHLGKATVRLTVSKLITLCISMVTCMLLARVRTIEEYGTYSQLLLIADLFTALFMLGLPSSINYFLSLANTREEQKKFLSVYYTCSTILSFIMGGVLVLAVPLIVKYFDNPALNGFIYFFALYPWANVISSGIENILVVYDKTRFLMTYRFINSVCLLIIVLLVQFFQWTFATYMALYLVVFAGFAIAVYVISAYLSGGLKICFDIKFIKKILVFSIPIGLASVVGTLNVEMDKLMIGYLMDTEQLAIYTNAAKELPITVVATAITAVLLPRLTVMIKESQEKEAVALWGKATELSLIVIGLIVAGIFVYAEDVMTFLYSEKYLPGVSVFRIYTLILILRCTYFGIMLNAKGKTKAILISSICALVLNAILNPLFYFWLGMIGPAIATALSLVIIQVGQLILTSYFTKVPFKDVFPWGRACVILFINFVFGVIFFIVKQIVPLEQVFGSLLESIILGVIWALIYLFVMQKRIKNLWKTLK